MHKVSKSFWCFPTHFFILTVALLGSAAVQAEEGGLGSSGLMKIHPFLAVDTVYDSNINYSYNSDGQLSDLALSLSTGVDLDVSRPKWVWSGKGQLGYRRYLGLAKTETSKYSDLQMDLRTDYSFNPQGSVGVDTTIGVQRSAEPRVQGQPTDKGSGLYAHWFLFPGVALNFRPGGKAMTFVTNYSLSMNLYDADTGLGEANYRQHLVGGKWQWKFLPKTAVELSGSYDLYDYNSAVESSALKNRDSSTIRLAGGLVGQVTPRIGVRLRGGYGTSKFSGATAAETPPAALLMQVGVDYSLATATLQKASFNYVRTLEPASLYQYFVDNMVSADFSRGLGRRLVASMGGSLHFLAFGEPTTGPSGQRNDLVGKLDASLTFNFSGNFDTSLRYTFDVRRSSYNVTAIDGSTFPVNYAKNQVALSLRAKL